jgi:predicted TIM-barrel fold metal-dependent hydrolase
MPYELKGRKKSFPIFDCDSHVYEPREVWDTYIPASQREFAKTHFYRDADRLVSVRNGAVTFGNPARTNYAAECWHPGLTKDDIGATAPGTPEWDEKIGRKASARDPHARLKDMDAAGIDQVMIFPSTFVYAPLVKNAEAARICCTAYNDWVYDYCAVSPKRIFPCAVLPVQNVEYAREELRRVAKRGFKAALVRPIIANNAYPTFPEFDPLWREFEELGVVLAMHTFPARGEALSPQLAQRMAGRGRLFGDEDVDAYTPGQFVANVMQIMGSNQAGSSAFSFIMEAFVWTGVVLMTGWLQKFPRLKVAVLESNCSWLPLLLEKAETYLDLYKYTQKSSGAIEDPKEIFYRRCFIAFESDEDVALRLWDLYENIAVWSSDMPHLDSATGWEAIDNMNRWKVPPAAQEKMLGKNACRLYGIEPQLFVRQAPEEYVPMRIPRAVG